MCAGKRLKQSNASSATVVMISVTGGNRWRYGAFAPYNHCRHLFSRVIGSMLEIS